MAVYEHGLPFSEILKINIDDGLERVKKNKATCIIIDGSIGEGKTTLAIEIADYINSTQNLPVVDLSNNKNAIQVAMGGKQFSKKIKDCFLNNLPAIIYDEAGDYSKRGAMTQFNAFLNRIFDTYRALKIVVILVLPNMNVLDNTLFDNKIPRLILHLENRDTYGNFKGYSLHRAYYLRSQMKKLEDKSFAYRIVDPNFYGQFLDLPRERQKALDKLTIESKIGILDTIELQIEGLIDRREIANRIAKSVAWVTVVLTKLNIKPSKYVKKVAYYDKGIVGILQDFIMNG